MILQLLFLDVSSDKYIDIWNHCFGKKNLLNPIKNWEKNRIFNWWKNLLNLIKKQRRKPKEVLIDEKSLKFDKKTRRKTNYLLFYKE